MPRPGLWTSIRSGTTPPRLAAATSHVRTRNTLRLGRRHAVAVVAAILLAGGALTGTSAYAASRRSHGHAAHATTFTFGRQGSLLTRSFNPYNPNWVNFLSNTAMMQLAFQRPFDLLGYYPELASSITISGSMATGRHITVTLQRDQWTNGKPLTSADVFDSFLIEGAGGGNTIWIDLKNVTTPNAHEIVFTLLPGILADQVMPSIDTIIPVPASQYAHLLPASLKAELLADYRIYRKSPTNASSSTVGKAVAAVDKAVVAFSPARLISDGPYELHAINTSEILMSKWRGFWDASAFTIPTLKFTVLGSNNAVYPAMLSGAFDETLVGMPKLIVGQAEHTPHLTLFKNGDGTTVKGLFFNLRQYPFNMRGVRQAIAELINRQALVNDVWGQFKSGAGGAQVIKYPSPISPTIQAAYLTSTQVDHLNPYNYDPTAARTTLESLGFKDSSSGWVMPNGKPFDVTIMAPSGWSGPDLASTYLGTLFNGIGIHAQVVEPQYEQFYSDLTGGNFDMIYFWTSCCEITNPLSELTLPLSDYNYSSPSEPGLGIGPVTTIPGIGRVNVSEAITREAAAVPIATERFDKLVYDWVRWFNSALPVYDIGFQTAFSVYDTSRFTDWPPKGSPIFETQTQGSQGQEILAMQEGYIHAR